MVRRAVRPAVPAAALRPGLRAQHGRRDGELGLRHLDRRGDLPVAADLRPAAEPGQRADARDGAHVVRRPGDDALVGRPVAQRGVRLLGGHLGVGGRRDRAHRRVGGLPRRPEARGLPRRHEPGHAPDPGRRARRRPGDGQLRRHHLLQGPERAQAAVGVRRRRRVRARPAGLLPRPRLGQHAPRRPDRRRRRGVRARPLGVDDRRGWTSAGTDTIRLRRRGAVDRRARTAASRARTASTSRATPSAATPCRPSATTPVATTGTTVERRPARGRPAPAQRRRPDLRVGPARRRLPGDPAEPCGRPARPALARAGRRHRLGHAGQGRARRRRRRRRADRRAGDRAEPDRRRVLPRRWR